MKPDTPEPDHELPKPDRPEKPDTKPDEKPDKPGRRPKPTPYGAADYPRPLVRLRFVPGGFDAEVRMVGSSEEEARATGDGGGGWQTIAVPEHDPEWQEYPKWLYHADGRQGQVWSQAQAESLGAGFEESPPVVEGEPDRPVVRGGWPVAPQAPPTPVDRGPG